MGVVSWGDGWVEGTGERGIRVGRREEDRWEGEKVEGGRYLAA